jgi:beta-1,4-mannosyl-glycoprotein beta-1,4-N-acetylglucosaminyltransferase
MIDLPEVTLVCIDCVDAERALFALRKSMRHIRYGRVKLLTSIGLAGYDDIEIVPIRELSGMEDYSNFMFRDLNDYIDTAYALIIQWDGFVVNPAAWTDEFLRYDYIGAPWYFRIDDGNMAVGNGGFSLRSKRLLETVQKKLRITDNHPEDWFICTMYREVLEYHGIKFAPVELAYTFSVENEIYKGSFGWHGYLNNIPEIWDFAEKNKENCTRSFIYDCFTFYNEFDLLELRLNSLSPSVDRFVLVESTHTFSGKKKRLFYDEVKDIEPFVTFKDKIIHIVHDEPPSDDRWANEFAQRNAIRQGLEGINPYDIVLISDVDEIINPAVFEQIRMRRVPGGLAMKSYNYFLNCRVLDEDIFTARYCRWQDYTEAQTLRDAQLQIGAFIKNGGWHFSYFGAPETISEKIASFAHAEYDTEFHRNVSRISKCINMLVDPLERKGYDLSTISLDAPEYVLRNRDKYRKYIAITLGIGAVNSKLVEEAALLEGPSSIGELECLSDLASQSRTIIETGCSDMRSTKVLADAGNTVLIADTAPETDPTWITRWESVFSEEIGEGRVELIRGNDADVFERLKEKNLSADLLVIHDSVNHDNPEGNIFSSLVRPGGYIWKQGEYASLRDLEIERMFLNVCDESSDIKGHLPTLKNISRMCGHVTEMVAQTGISIVALLAGKPEKVVSYTIHDDGDCIDKLSKIPLKTVYTIAHGDSLSVEIEETDFLFIDTYHTYDRLSKELERHADSVRKYIALHDTITFGLSGEDGSTPGLQKAVTDFLQKNTAWKVMDAYHHYHGFMVLERNMQPANR